MTLEPGLRLGIDGGGSKTRFLLVNAMDQEVARAEAGPSNWLSVGRDAARQALAKGLSHLPARPVLACGGFAGAGRPEGVQFFEETIRELLPDAQIFIHADAFIACVGALGQSPGVLLIAGTGSIALGRTPDGRTIRCGGWGPMFGDEGSGFWIGREAIRTALRSNDRGEFPEFAEAIRAALSLEDISHAVTLWSQGDLDVPGVAALARAVLKCYPNEPARSILEQAGSHLRDLVVSIEKKIGPGDWPRSITGSLGADPIIQALIGVPFSPPLHTPERGAILWLRAHVP